MIALRPYQTNVIAEFHRTTARFKRVILVAPTGAGKTVIGAEIIKDYVARHRTVLVLAHRREIVNQTRAKLREAGVWCGVIMAGADRLEAMPGAPVQVASVQTLDARAMRGNRLELPPADLVVVDECHHATARTWRAILDAYPDATVLGLTATPCRADGKGLGAIFETMIECPGVGDLIELGFLVKPRVYAPAAPDLDGVATRQGDYVMAQLETAMDKDELVADIVTTWLKYGERRPTVCFATGVGHSVHIRDRFVEAGARCEHIDGGTPNDERDEALDALAEGRIEVLTNCMVLTEGWDLPVTACCILARPTKQLGLYRQMVGRVLRPAPGKTDAVVLDHAGACFRHGLPEDPIVWQLSEDRTARNAAHEGRTGDHFGAPKFLECSQCGAVREGGKPCFTCGFLPVRRPDIVIPREGDLALVEGRKPGVVPQDKPLWHASLAAIAIENGYKPGWIAHKFKEKFGHFPPYGFTPKPVDPTPEIRSWVKSRQIAFAKARDRP